MSENVDVKESLWWRNLKRVCGGLDQSKTKWFEKGMEWKLGDGDHIKFWVDEWLGEHCLAYLYPRLFLNSLKKSELECDMGRWRREWFVWEENMINDLNHMFLGWMF